MKTAKEFGRHYFFKAISENGAFKVVSYIANKKIGMYWKKVYGYWDYKNNIYVEEATK